MDFDSIRAAVVQTAGEPFLHVIMEMTANLWDLSDGHHFHYAEGILGKIPKTHTKALLLCVTMDETLNLKIHTLPTQSCVLFTILCALL